MSSKESASHVPAAPTEKQLHEVFTQFDAFPETMPTNLDNERFVLGCQSLRFVTRTPTKSTLRDWAGIIRPLDPEVTVFSRNIMRVNRILNPDNPALFTILGEISDLIADGGSTMAAQGDTADTITEDDMLRYVSAHHSAVLSARKFFNTLRAKYQGNYPADAIFEASDETPSSDEISFLDRRAALRILSEDCDQVEKMSSVLKFLRSNKCP